jgi:hypothetical protein
VRNTVKKKKKRVQEKKKKKKKFKRYEKSENNSMAGTNIMTEVATNHTVDAVKQRIMT